MATAEAEYSMTQGAYERGDGAGDENLFVRFFHHHKEDRRKTLEAGRPIHADKEYIEIRIPGDKDNIYIGPAEQKYINRFPRHYAAFKNKEQEVVIGTPLEAVPWVTKAQIEELKYFGVRSVEQLAGVTDANAQSFVGINSLRDQAKAFLEAAAGNAPLLQMQAELEKRDKQLEAMQKQMEEMSKMMAAQEDKPDVKTKQGRARI